MGILHCLRNKKFFFIVIIILIQVVSFGESIQNVKAKEAIMSESDKEADKKIKSVWNEMRAALKAGDINKALKYFSPNSYAENKEMLEIIGSDLPAAANEMGDIEFVSINENVAEYNTQRYEVINGHKELIDYSVHFIRDSDGVWYIDEF
jgi:hypothetical protein